MGWSWAKWFKKDEKTIQNIATNATITNNSYIPSKIKTQKEKSYKTLSLFFSIDGIQFSESVAAQFDDLTCSKCGAIASQGNFFMMECQTDSLLIVAALQPSKTHWVQKEQKFRNLVVKHIKCMKCFHDGLVADFSEKIEDGFRATVAHIQDKWTALVCEGKTFFVLTGIVPRSVGENQVCCVHGIPLNTIPNQSKVEDEGVYITP